MFQSPLDVCKRACQHLGVRQITTMADNSVEGVEVVFAYDKLRRAHLRRNVWTFATKRVILRPLTGTTRIVVPPVWSPTTVFYSGQLCQYTDPLTGQLQYWQSNIPNNLNNPPIANGIPSVAWVAYFGPLSVDGWQSSTTPTNPISSGYGNGELAYIAPGDGSVYVYASKAAGNTDDPWQVDIWASSQLYTPGQLVSVTVGTTVYESTVDFNYGNDPSIVLQTAPWSSTVNYVTGQYVTGSDNRVYLALQNSHAQDPTLDFSFVYWTPSIVASDGTTQQMYGGTWKLANPAQPRATSQSWFYVANGAAPLFLPYPVSAGPLEQTNTLNAFLLPNGYLRDAPLTPKDNEVPYLGAPIGNAANDYVYESGFIISSSQRPITIRFVCDVTAVSAMDDLFCEMLSASIALNVWERVTNKTGSLATVNGVFQQAQDAAARANAIEQGPTEFPLDQFLSVRF